MKYYQPEVYFASEIENKNKEEFVEVVILSLTRGATFSVTIVSVNCNALIDTGAMRKCKSKTSYNQLMSPQLLKAFCLLVPSTSGSTFRPMGIIQCLLHLEGIPLSSILLFVEI